MTDMQNMERSTTVLRDRFDKVRLRYAHLNGMEQSMLQRKAERTEEVSLAKARIEMAPQVTDLLEKLQTRAHERSVGVFENLLSAIVQDIFPEKGGVKLTLGTERNAPALDIAMKNGDKEEDILEGNGGAITNVVVAGLKYAAQFRTDTRSFMVFDEPDCWLKPERVPAFVKVISDVATRNNTQTLLISHHNADLLEGDVSLIRLEKDETGKTVAVPLEPRNAQWENDEEPGLRWIELINVRAHEHTLIPLFPRVNALIGDNDLGKSTAFVSALRAVAYGDSTDSIISHNADHAIIRIGLENGYVVEWKRVLKGSPKVTYKLFQNDVLLNEGKPESKGSVPEWVDDVLKIHRVDGMDIQLGSQKSPVFLLDEAPSRRAQLLSVGRESGFLHSLIDKHRQWMTNDRKTVRDGEVELMRIERHLRVLEDIRGAATIVEMLGKLIQDVEATEKAERSVQLILQKLEGYGKEVDALTQRLNVLANLPKAPTLLENADLRKLIARMGSCEKALAAEVPAELPKVPELHDNAPIVAIGSRIGQLTARIQIMEQVPLQPILVPTVTRNVDLGKSAELIGRLQESIERLTREEAQTVAEENAAKAGLDSLRKELGFCPLCGSEFAEHKH